MIGCVWSDNRVDGHVYGPVVQAGRSDAVHVHAVAPARNHCLEPVEDLAPAELVGRRGALTALAQFCTPPDTEGRHAWWRAGAWSGKTAVMARFALHPPSGVRVVPFFITSRSADRNSRAHFLDNLSVQLSALLGHPLAPSSPATAEAQARGPLREAARWCRERGEHFVLGVDGLDEVRGVDGAAHSHSIAACLPVVPLEGTRAIVTGRALPPLPGDVPGSHPLRDPAVVRPPAPSPRTEASGHEASGHEAERGLKRVLEGDGTDPDLVGLVAAARAGLTTADLAHPTDTSTWEVEDRLATLTGRSFVTRTGRHPGRSPDTHRPAHEELQRTAVRVLDRLPAGYRERLHRWCDDYRGRHRPADTPDLAAHGDGDHADGGVGTG